MRLSTLLIFIFALSVMSVKSFGQYLTFEQSFRLNDNHNISKSDV